MERGQSVDLIVRRSGNLTPLQLELTPSPESNLTATGGEFKSGQDSTTVTITAPHEARDGTVRVRVRAGTGWALRTPEAPVAHGDDGWDELEVGYSDPERLADRVASFGADVVVLHPPAARDAVARRLRAAAGVGA